MFGPVSTALMSLYSLAADADGYVCTEDDGSPLHPDHYSDQFAAICASAGLPKCRLHDCRHSDTLLEHAGVPDSIRAAYLGHTVAVNTSVYPPRRCP
jgi:integrase